MQHPDMTPAERNRIRILRDAIDDYERRLAPFSLDTIVGRAQELRDAGVDAHNERVRLQNERTDRVIDDWVAASRRVRGEAQ